MDTESSASDNEIILSKKNTEEIIANQRKERQNPSDVKSSKMTGLAILSNKFESVAQAMADGMIKAAQIKADSSTNFISKNDKLLEQIAQLDTKVECLTQKIQKGNAINQKANEQNAILIQALLKQLESSQ